MHSSDSSPPSRDSLTNRLNNRPRFHRPLPLPHQPQQPIQAKSPESDRENRMSAAHSHNNEDLDRKFSFAKALSASASNSPEDRTMVDTSNQQSNSKDSHHNCKKDTFYGKKDTEESPSEVGSEARSEPITFKRWTGYALHNPDSRKEVVSSNASHTTGRPPQKSFSDAPFGRAHFRLAAKLGQNLATNSTTEEEKKEDEQRPSPTSGDGSSHVDMRLRYGRSAALKKKSRKSEENKQENNKEPVEPVPWPNEEPTQEEPQEKSKPPNAARPVRRPPSLFSKNRKSNSLTSSVLSNLQDFKKNPIVSPSGLDTTEISGRSRGPDAKEIPVEGQTEVGQAVACSNGKKILPSTRSTPFATRSSKTAQPSQPATNTVTQTETTNYRNIGTSGVTGQISSSKPPSVTNEEDAFLVDGFHQQSKIETGKKQPDTNNIASSSITATTENQTKGIDHDNDEVEEQPELKVETANNKANKIPPVFRSKQTARREAISAQPSQAKTTIAASAGTTCKSTKQPDKTPVSVPTHGNETAAVEHSDPNPKPKAANLEKTSITKRPARLAKQNSWIKQSIESEELHIAGGKTDSVVNTESAKVPAEAGIPSESLDDNVPKEMTIPEEKPLPPGRSASGSVLDMWKAKINDNKKGQNTPSFPRKNNFSSSETREEPLKTSPKPPVNSTRKSKANADLETETTEKLDRVDSKQETILSLSQTNEIQNYNTTEDASKSSWVKRAAQDRARGAVTDHGSRSWKSNYKSTIQGGFMNSEKMDTVKKIVENPSDEDIAHEKRETTKDKTSETEKDETNATESMTQDESDNRIENPVIREADPAELSVAAKKNKFMQRLRSASPSGPRLNPGPNKLVRSASNGSLRSSYSAASELQNSVSKAVTKTDRIPKSVASRYRETIAKSASITSQEPSNLVTEKTYSSPKKDHSKENPSSASIPTEIHPVSSHDNEIKTQPSDGSNYSGVSSINPIEEVPSELTTQSSVDTCNRPSKFKVQVVRTTNQSAGASIAQKVEPVSKCGMTTDLVSTGTGTATKPTAMKREETILESKDDDQSVSESSSVIITPAKVSVSAMKAKLWGSKPDGQIKLNVATAPRPSRLSLTTNQHENADTKESNDEQTEPSKCANRAQPTSRATPKSWQKSYVEPNPKTDHPPSWLNRKMADKETGTLKAEEIAVKTKIATSSPVRPKPVLAPINASTDDSTPSWVRRRLEEESETTSNSLREASQPPPADITVHDEDTTVHDDRVAKNKNDAHNEDVTSLSKGRLSCNSADPVATTISRSPSWVKRNQGSIEKSLKAAAKNSSSNSKIVETENTMVARSRTKPKVQAASNLGKNDGLPPWFKQVTAQERPAKQARASLPSPSKERKIKTSNAPQSRLCPEGVSGDHSPKKHFDHVDCVTEPESKSTELVEASPCLESVVAQTSERLEGQTHEDQNKSTPNESVASGEGGEQTETPGSTGKSSRVKVTLYNQDNPWSKDVKRLSPESRRKKRSTPLNSPKRQGDSPSQATVSPRIAASSKTCPQSLGQMAADSIHAFDYEQAVQRLEKRTLSIDDDEESVNAPEYQRSIPADLPPELAKALEKKDVSNQVEGSPDTTSVVFGDPSKFGAAGGEDQNAASLKVKSRAKALEKWNGGLGAPAPKIDKQDIIRKEIMRHVSVDDRAEAVSTVVDAETGTSATNMEVDEEEIVSERVFENFEGGDRDEGIQGETSANLNDNLPTSNLKENYEDYEEEQPRKSHMGTENNTSHSMDFWTSETNNSNWEATDADFDELGNDEELNIALAPITLNLDTPKDKAPDISIVDEWAENDVAFPKADSTRTGKKLDDSFDPFSATEDEELFQFESKPTVSFCSENDEKEDQFQLRDDPFQPGDDPFSVELNSRNGKVSSGFDPFVDSSNARAPPGSNDSCPFAVSDPFAIDAIASFSNTPIERKSNRDGFGFDPFGDADFGNDPAFFDNSSDPFAAQPPFVVKTAEGGIGHDKTQCSGYEADSSNIHDSPFGFEV